jgi:hypothetical protein
MTGIGQQRHGIGHDAVHHFGDDKAGIEQDADGEGATEILGGMRMTGAVVMAMAGVTGMVMRVVCLMVLVVTMVVMTVFVSVMVFVIVGHEWLS